MRKPRNWYKINSLRNSECSTLLSNLDFMNFWQDGDHIHVCHKSDDTVWRVYCKWKGYKIEIGMIKSELYWIVR